MTRSTIRLRSSSLPLTCQYRDPAPVPSSSATARMLKPSSPSRSEDDQGRVDDALPGEGHAPCRPPVWALGPWWLGGRLGALVWLHPDHPTIESNTVC